VRTTDTVARVGGDEFVVLLEALHDRAEAVVIREKLIAGIGQPVLLPAGAVRVGASVGIAMCPEQTDDIDQLLLLADQDMYRAKASRQGQPAALARDWVVDL
jgi:diguanylate cyclase (GGDEF)-like protein